LVEPPKTGRTREKLATLPSRFPEIEEAPMAHWPKTVRGNLFAFVLALLVLLAVVQFAIVLSGPFVWASLAVVILGTAVLIARNRRAAAAHDLALGDAPSFGDVLPNWNRRDELERYPAARTAKTSSA
jgi:hypothetical protein